MSYANKAISVTVHGKYHFLCGPDWDTGLTPPSLDRKGTAKYVEIGEGNSYYYHYHVNGSCWTKRSGNLESEYPGLGKFLEDKQAFGCPEIVSLGYASNYFARVEANGVTWTSYKLHSKILNEIGDMSNVAKLWIGRDLAYVCVKKNGAKIWNLRGNYSYLDEVLGEKRGAIPKSLALNVEDSEAFVVVWENGGMNYHPGEGTFDASSVKTFGRLNFGLNW